MLEKYGKDITLCSKCNKGKLVWMCTTYAKDENSLLQKKITPDEQINIMAGTLNNKTSP